jgi:CRP/FNR family nitrogen fixation transcriptional regulator
MRDLNLEISGGPVASRYADFVRFGDVELPGVRMSFERNGEVFGAGEPAEYLYKVVSGAVRTMRFSSDGRRQILAFHLPGDIFGFEFRASHDFSAEAVADSEVVLIRRSLVEKAANEHLGASHALLQLTNAWLHEAQEHNLVLGRKGAGERVAAFLLGLADRFTASEALDLPMSRLDIADYLALTIETVSRAFTQMERDHAIALPSSRRVVVRDRCALEMLQAA